MLRIEFLSSLAVSLFAFIFQTNITPMKITPAIKTIINLNLFGDDHDLIGVNGKIKIAYMHAAARKDIDILKGMVEERITVEESLISELPPALGVHTGPGTTGLCYFPVV